VVTMGIGERVVKPATRVVGFFLAKTAQEEISLWINKISL